MNYLHDHEPRESIEHSSEERKHFFRSEVLDKIIHADAREHIMQYDLHLQPVKREAPRADEERQEEIRNVEDRRLDIRLEWHPAECVRVPERKMAAGERDRGEVPECVVLVDEIFPEERLLEKNITEENGDQDSNRENGLPILQREGGRGRPYRRFAFFHVMGHSLTTIDEML